MGGEGRDLYKVFVVEWGRFWKLKGKVQFIKRLD